MTKPAMYNEFAPFYDLEYGNKKEDVDFYLDVANHYGDPVLELGAGTGRISVELAQAGHHVIALDSSGPMLERLRSKIKDRDLEIDTILGDMQDFELPHPVPLCIMPFRTFAHNLSLKDQLDTLYSIHDNLQPGAFVVFDLFVPLHHVLAKTEWSETFTLENAVTCTSLVRHDPVAQRLNIKNQYFKEDDDSPVGMAEYTYRYMFPSEVELLLHCTGFDCLRIYGGFQGEPYDYFSGSMIFVAQKVQ
ncbi:methyltransferase domain-containing protein [candidate division KSB1 bacterium]|nr:methyltransferase domain-containing protein [candidate division KSB1 bacterium]